MVVRDEKWFNALQDLRMRILRLLNIYLHIYIYIYLVIRSKMFARQSIRVAANAAKAQPVARRSASSIASTISCMYCFTPFT